MIENLKGSTESALVEVAFCEEGSDSAATLSTLHSIVYNGLLLVVKFSSYHSPKCVISLHMNA